MLEVRGLHKRYGDLVAVQEVSFTVRPGEAVGLLGPNGAGKTTTVSMIAGLVTPDAGEVRIEGGVVRGETDPLKRKMGLVPQDLALHDLLSARDNLALFGALYGMRGAELRRAMDAALDLVGLADRAGDRVVSLRSLGNGRAKSERALEMGGRFDVPESARRALAGSEVVPRRLRVPLPPLEMHGELDGHFAFAAGVSGFEALGDLSMPYSDGSGSVPRQRCVLDERVCERVARVDGAVGPSLGSNV